MRRIILLFLTSVLLGGSAFSASVDTVSVFSNKMGKSVKAIVVKPQQYAENGRLPVLYLLHGYSDQYDGWITKVPLIKELSDQYKMMIVCPDGAFGSWYVDSPVDSSFQYETFITKELIAWIDDNYKTIPSRKARAITGLSMGGHGGLYLGFRNQEMYGACGSMSGAVDIRPFSSGYDIPKRIGSYSENPNKLEEYTVIGLLHLLTPDGLKIIIDCGTEDFLYEVNEKLHEELLYRNIPHDYITRPGVHDWKYWSNAIKYQCLFFSDYFRSQQE